MKTFTFFLLQFCLLFFAFGVPAQTIKPVDVQPNMKQNEKTAKLPEVREELLKRLKAAREIRAELVKNNNGGNSGASVQQLVKMDQDNNSWLQSAVEKYGWLGFSLVGKDGEDAAFKLVMLAMQAPQLQKQSLELLQQAVKNGEARGDQLALLTERMNTTLGKTSVPAGAVVQSENGMKIQKLNSDTAADVQIRTETNQKYMGVPVPAEAKEKMWKIDADNT